MNFEYGKIVNLEENEKGYITISIEQCKAFRKVLRKFNVWNVEYLKRHMGSALRIETSVRFQAVSNGRFFKLHTIEESPFDECFGCGSYVPERNKQQMECEHCIHLMERKRIDRDMKVVKKNIKQYQFNSGVTLSLIDETENSLIKTLYVTTVFENSPLYSKACGLNVGDVQQFGGWLNISDNQLTIFFEVVDIDDM